MSYKSCLSVKLILITLIFSTINSSYAFIDKSWEKERPPLAAFDPGPSLNVDDKMAGELIDLHANIPYFPGVAKEIMRGGKQKFRPAYGPIPWRMILKPNNVKILFIGQDGTHVAEAAGRPATAGFGGRAQDLAKFFGVEYSAAFINAYAFTIKGQYSARNAPYLLDGKIQTRGSITPNDVWLMTNDKDGPIQIWRSDLIEWIIKNNQDSLKLIVLFGQAAKDSIASFIESRGGKVEAFMEHQMDQVQVPEFKLSYAGGNNEFPVALNKSGKDLYQEILGKLNYKSSGQQKALSLIKNNSDELISKMVFSKAGPYKNGIFHPAQLGGFNLDKIFINSDEYQKKNATRSLRGLQLKNGDVIKNDVLVVALPHPTFLSITMNEGAIAYWKKSLKDNPTYIGKLADNAKIKKTEMFKFLEKVLKKLADKDLAKELGETGYKFENKKAAVKYWNDELKDTWEYTLVKSTYAKVPKHNELTFMKNVLKSIPDKELGKSIKRAGYQKGKEKVAKLVEKDVKKIRPYKENGWNIKSDFNTDGQKIVNRFNKKEDNMYDYGRSDIHNVFYDFGTPKNRMVSKSTARRGAHSDEAGHNKGPQIIIFGSRDVPSYDTNKINHMLASWPNEELELGEMFISRLRTDITKLLYDQGPEEKYARLMKDIDYKSIYRAKSGMSFSKDGISAFNIKSHPSVGDFGHYRGTFNNPRVIILADPDGYDDLITARALTGTRGQYLHGLMDDLGVGDQYLIIKTVPFGMDNATDKEWEYVLGKTMDYRTNLLVEILKDSNPDLIIADGKYAKREILRILSSKDKKNFVSVARNGEDKSFGIEEASKLINIKIGSLNNKNTSGLMKNIPKTHLSYYARTWEGTCGDRVIDSKGKKYQGLAFLEVAPNWVVEQRPVMLESTEDNLKNLHNRMMIGGFPMPSEKIRDFCERKECSYEK